MNATTTTIDATDHGGGTLMPLGRVVRAYAVEAKYEALRVLRTPGIAIPFLLLPVPIYLFFGVMIPGAEIAKNPAVGSYLFVSWCVFAAMGPGMFGAGCALAADREAGLFRLKRAQPAPAGAWLIAKTVVAMGFTAVAVLSLVVAAAVMGSAHLAAWQLLTVAAVMVVGTIPFCAIGLCIGARTSAAAAPAILNMLFLPMLWLSGLFFPLPGILEKFVVIWPAFHLNQLATGWAGIDQFSFVAPAVAAAVLLGVTVLCCGLAIRRLTRQP